MTVCMILAHSLGELCVCVCGLIFVVSKTYNVIYCCITIPMSPLNEISTQKALAMITLSY